MSQRGKSSIKSYTSNLSKEKFQLCKKTLQI